MTDPTNAFKRFLLGLILIGVALTICLIGTASFVFSRYMPNNLSTLLDISTPTPYPTLVGRAPEITQNSLAYIGNDDHIWLINPDGSEQRPVTRGDLAYQFPTWSPDSRYLAFIGPDPQGITTLYVTATEDPQPDPIFNTRGSSPFYLYWSPDSMALTFLTSEDNNMAMRLVNTRTGEDRLIERGSPFYWAWSPLGDRLLMHVGGSRAYSELAHLSLIDNAPGAERTELDFAPGSFQAPAWSNDAQTLYFIATDGAGEDTLYKTDTDRLDPTALTTLDGLTYLVLSPDNRHIAYVEVDGTRPPFGFGKLISTNGSEPQLLLDQPIGSLYWSPDGRKIALLTVVRQEDGSTAGRGGLAAPLPQEIFFRWLIYDVDTGETEGLLTFVPTLDFLQTVPYFDQYHLSLTFWSPDSRYFIVTKGSYQDEDGTVWVYDTTGAEDPRQIAEGTLAVWSWQ